VTLKWLELNETDLRRVDESLFHRVASTTENVNFELDDTQRTPNAMPLTVTDWEPVEAS
jgi:cysteine sulfinate desulfinase/cysteine desulfurase-like protein